MKYGVFEELSLGRIVIIVKLLCSVNSFRRIVYFVKCLFRVVVVFDELCSDTFLIGSFTIYTKTSIATLHHKIEINEKTHFRHFSLHPGAQYRIRLHVGLCATTLIARYGSKLK